MKNQALCRIACSMTCLLVASAAFGELITTTHSDAKFDFAAPGFQTFFVQSFAGDGVPTLNGVRSLLHPDNWKVEIPGQFGGNATFDANVMVTGDGSNLGIDIHCQATATGDFFDPRFNSFNLKPIAEIFAEATYSDDCTVKGTGVFPINRSLVFHYVANGSTETRTNPFSTPALHIADIAIFLQEKDGPGYASFNYQYDSSNPQQKKDVSLTAAFTKTLDGANHTPVKFSFGALARCGDGTCEFEFGRTAKLTKITFTDGTTPEERGFELVFASGLRSPNVAVPEPPAFVLLMFAVAGCCVRRDRAA